MAHTLRRKQERMQVLFFSCKKYPIHVILEIKHWDDSVIQGNTFKPHMFKIVFASIPILLTWDKKEKQVNDIYFY